MVLNVNVILGVLIGATSSLAGALSRSPHVSDPVEGWSRSARSSLLPLCVPDARGNEDKWVAVCAEEDGRILYFASMEEGLLHPVLEVDRRFAVDYDGDGEEEIAIDGSGSHTHEAGKSLSSYSFKVDGKTVSATVSEHAIRAVRTTTLKSYTDCRNVVLMRATVNGTFDHPLVMATIPLRSL